MCEGGARSEVVKGWYSTGDQKHELRSSGQCRIKREERNFDDSRTYKRIIYLVETVNCIFENKSFRSILISYPRLYNIFSLRDVAKPPR